MTNGLPMLHEIQAVRQDALPLRRRWFQDDYFDVFLWTTQDNTVRTFQLAYRRGRGEGVLEWSAEQGFSHSQVDEGDDDPRASMTPLMILGGRCPVREIEREFTARSMPLDAPLRAFMLKKLRHARRLRRVYGRQRRGGFVAH